MGGLTLHASVRHVLQGAVVAIENQERRIFGLQYHPEVMHTEQGTDTLRHILLDIAGLTADWTMAEVLETQLKLLQQQVGSTAQQASRQPTPQHESCTPFLQMLHQALLQAFVLCWLFKLMGTNGSCTCTVSRLDWWLHRCASRVTCLELG